MKNKFAELFASSDTLSANVEHILSLPSPEAYFNEKQGGCSDGRYYYQTFMHRDRASNEEKNECRIAKVDIHSGDIVALSEVFHTLNHSNDIVYNKNRDLLVVCHNNPHCKRISLVDPHTLTLVQSIDISENIYSIDYNPARDIYVVGRSGGQTLMFLDSEFRPIDGVVHPATERTRGYTTQGICSDESFVYCVLFDGKRFRRPEFQNVITVYDWNGNFVGIIEFDAGMTEPENLSFIDGELYVCSCLDKFDLFKLTPKFK